MKLSRIVVPFAVLAVVAVAYSYFTPQIETEKNLRSRHPVESTALRAATIKSATLNNRLQIVVIPDGDRRNIIHMVWYKAGSVDDQPGKRGLAHLVEHLTFGGTANTPGSQFHRIFEKNARKQEAITTRDYTVYYPIVAPEKLETFVALEADRMNNAVFPRLPGV